MTRRLTAMTALVLSLLLGCASEQPVPDKAIVDCDSKKCYHDTLNIPEIQALNDGFVYIRSELQYPPSHWLVIDFERSQIIEIERYSGKAYRQDIQNIPQTKTDYFRQTDQRTDIVEITPLPQDKAKILHANAEEIWKSNSSFSRFTTDISSNLVLVQGRQERHFGGPGILDGLANQLVSQAQSLLKARDHSAMEPIRQASWGPDGFVYQVGDRAFFASNSAALDDATKEQLNRWAYFLGQYSFLIITIQGHADARGKPAFNKALSLRRAEAARDYLTAQGIGAKRITIEAYGQDRPAVLGDKEEAWRLNRRVTGIVFRE